MQEKNISITTFHKNRLGDNFNSFFKFLNKHKYLMILVLPVLATIIVILYFTCYEKILDYMLNTAVNEAEANFEYE